LSLDQYSSIDYILTSSACGVKRFGVLDPDINFSDHIPLIIEITTCSHIDSRSVCGSSHSRASDLLMQLRWDKCNSAAYYDYTRVHLAPLSDLVSDILEKVEGRKISFYDIVNNIELCYTSIVSVLSSAGKMFVPNVRKGFFKWWWNDNLTLLKKSSADSNKAWKAAGKPRQGPMFY